jgi:pimeloyl-ACP methyl ester carboxylesterase
MQAPELIQVRSYGDSGPYVSLLHGGPGAAGEMVPVARNLCSRFRVLEPLQRTSGTVPLTVARHVKDLHDVLQEPLQAGPVRLVGFSWGAMLALTYAARYPEKIDRVILIGCGTFDKHSRQIYETNIKQRTDTDTQRHIENIQAQLTAENDRKRRNELFAEFGYIYTRLQSYKPIKTDFEKVLKYDEIGFRQTWAGALSLQEQGIQPAEFEHIQALVTMIHGDNDPHPGPLIYKTLTKFICDIKYLELSRCGHKPWIEIEAKNEFYKILTECLT